MKPLAPAEALHLSAAQGWLELGNPQEAGRELEKITPAFRAHPDVIELRCKVYAGAGKWRESALAALALVKMEPGRVAGWVLWADAFQKLRQIHGTPEEATLVPDDFQAYYQRLRFDLAAYACELTKDRAEWDWLQRALADEACETDSAAGER